MKKKLIAALLTACLVAGSACIPEINTFVPISLSAEAASVSAPSFSKSAGRYYASFSLKLTAVSGAKIYYTTNGTTPTANSTVYTGAITISKTTTVKAIAISSGVKSSVISKKYIISPKKPTSSLSSGTYNGAQTVTLKCKTSGAKIYYTLDGTKPTTKSTLYTGPITIDESCKLRAFAYVSGLTKSLYLTRTFTIEDAEAAFVPTTDYTDYTNKYGYSSLNSSEKKVYAMIYDAALVNKASIDISAYLMGQEQVSKIYSIVRNDNPWLFNLDSGFSFSYYTEDEIINLNLKYTMTSSEYLAALAKLKMRVDEIMKTVDAEKNLFGKLLIIHDEIVDNCVYTKGSSLVATAYGCLVNDKALCEGYSRAFQLLCHEAGIQNILITGVSDGEGHMWNMLQLDDEWYHFDMTWDDPISSSADNKTYDYFNVTTAQIKADHTIDDNYYTIPTANGTKYNYYTYNGIEIFTDTSRAITELKTLIAKAQKNKQTTVTIMCNETVYDGVVANFVKTQDYLSYFRTLNATASNQLLYQIMCSGRGSNNIELTLTLYY